MRKCAVIGGTSLLESDAFAHLKAKTVETPHGSAVIYVEGGDGSLVFVQRHHADGKAGAHVYRPPHLINHRATIAALKDEGVEAIVAVCCVGSLSEKIPIGTVVIPDDYFYMFGPPVSFYDDDRAHIVPGIDADLGARIAGALASGTVVAPEKLRKGGVYVQTVGPRFETPAEIRFLAPLGDIIGMTAASEATLTKELGISYAILAMVDNMANGLAGSELTHEQFKANVAKNKGTVEAAVRQILGALL